MFPPGAFRYVPDVSFSAADHDGYIGCFAAGGGSCIATTTGIPIIFFSGTSATAPAMAGIAALLNTKLGSVQANISPLLYSIAATSPGAFHDVTVATSGVAACTTSTPSMCNNSTPGPSTLAGGLAGFAVGPGYDEATGLGSLDVANFLAAAAGASPTSGSFTLTSGAATLTLAPGATSRNTDSITLTSGNGFAGTVALSCAFALTGGGTAQVPPSCTFNPASVTLTANGTASSVVTITTQGATICGVPTSQISTTSSGILLAGLFLLLPLRKRKAFRSLATIFVVAAGLMGMTGCGKGTTGVTCNVGTAGTTAGTYTVTITGTSGSTSAQTTFSLKIS